jgi:molecular chaperone DnaK
VSAKDKASGKEQSIRIEASSGLSEAEIDKMVNDAKKNESEDKDKHEMVDLHNQAEQLVYQTEKNIDEFGDKISDEEKKTITDVVERLKTANSGSNKDDIKSATDELNSEWNKLASKMYEASKETGQTTTETSSNGAEKKKKEEGEIEDADFEVVD